MARLVLPSRFPDKVTLHNNIAKKHADDGVGSVLIPFFNENDIDFDADVLAVANAVAAHKLFEQSGKRAEKLFKERDRIFAPVFKQHRRQVQFLKSLYANNTAKLGDWGVTVNKNRVVYPRSFEEKVNDVLFFIQKHLGYAPGSSPLQGFLNDEINADIDMAANAADCATALETHSAATALFATRKTQRAQRDLLMKIPVANYALIGGFLKTLFSANPNTAGDWGFIVDTSPKNTIIRKGFVQINGSKLLAKLAVGGVLVNNSDFNIELYKVKITSGIAIVLEPGKSFPITKGYGTITIKNPNSDQKALYQAVFLS